MLSRTKLNYIYINFKQAHKKIKTNPIPAYNRKMKNLTTKCKKPSYVDKQFITVKNQVKAICGQKNTTTSRRPVWID